MLSYLKKKVSWGGKGCFPSGRGAVAGVCIAPSRHSMQPCGRSRDGGAGLGVRQARGGQSLTQSHAPRAVVSAAWGFHPWRVGMHLEDWPLHFCTRPLQSVYSSQCAAVGVQVHLSCS